MYILEANSDLVVCVKLGILKVQGFGAGAARSRGIWPEPEPSL